MLVRPLTRPLTRGLTRLLTRVISRFFTEFLSSVNSYASPSSTPTITRLVMDVYPANGNAGLPTGAPAVTDDIFQTIDFAFVGTMPDIGRNGANYFDGIIANVYAYDGAALVGFWPMDDAPDSTYFRNTAAVLGSDIGSAIPTTVSGDWVDEGSGTFFIDDSVDASTVFWLGLLSPNTTYKVTFTITDYAGVAGVRPLNSDEAQLPYAAGNGVFDYVFQNAANNNFNLQPQAGFTGRVKLVVQEIPATTPYLTKQNIASDQTELFDKIDDGWTDGQLIVNGEFSTDTDWTKQAGVTISDGSLNTDGTTNGELARQSGIGLTAGAVYKVVIIISSISQGSIGVKIGGGATVTFSDSGTHTVDLSDGTLDNFQITGTSSAIASIDSVSVKRFLEVA